MYIPRTIEFNLIESLRANGTGGVILAGIVGCGKTTLVERVLQALEGEYKTFAYTGDDTRFRAAIRKDSKYLCEDIRGQTSSPAICFVDEVQKCEEIFDALKYAYDHGGIRFIVSGSNPHFLNTQARMRLQRRARLLTLDTFSLPELLLHKGLVSKSAIDSFDPFLCGHEGAELPYIETSPEIKVTIRGYLSGGGYPLAYLAASPREASQHLQNMVERGFEPLLIENVNLSDLVIMHLANHNSQEFTYKAISRVTGVKSRDDVNKVLQGLVGHGYLHAKRPILFSKEHRSYLSTYSWVDPGILSYLIGPPKDPFQQGHIIESIVHTRLRSRLQLLPYRSQIHYFKPYSVDSSGKVKYKPGEVDFVVECQSRFLPIEVKATENWESIDLRNMLSLLDQQNIPLGIVLYQGLPRWHKSRKVAFLPYWIV